MMIDNEYLKMMANDNQWPNESLYTAGDQLSDDARKRVVERFLDQSITHFVTSLWICDLELFFDDLIQVIAYLLNMVSTSRQALSRATCERERITIWVE